MTAIESSPLWKCARLVGGSWDSRSKGVDQVGDAGVEEGEV
jgi:hypothetical protein